MEVIAPGLQSTIQDWPGRVGHWRVGIPPSGPMDDLSFRLANLLVGNPAGTPALEFQFLGPTLRAIGSVDVALVGGEVLPTLDGTPVPMEMTLTIRAGQVLACGAVRRGARCYLAVAGGFDKEVVLGSAATFPRGGIGGGALAAGDMLSLRAPSSGRIRLRIKHGVLRQVPEPAVIEVTAGPHYDWLHPEGLAALVGTAWKVTAKSDRTGIRLEGPKIRFAERAYRKAPENGPEPTNVINTGYPVGGVNLCGETPIILPVDGPSQGGFITPVVVVSAALWKVGQLRPGQSLIFRRIMVREAIEMRKRLDFMASPASLEPMPAQEALHG